MAMLPYLKDHVRFPEALEESLKSQLSSNAFERVYKDSQM